MAATTWLAADGKGATDGCRPPLTIPQVQLKRLVHTKRVIDPAHDSNRSAIRNVRLHIIV
jgi:hypothetical protein